MFDSSRISKALVAALLASGCVVAPYDGQNIGVYDASFNITGYTDSPNAQLTIKALDFVDNTWDTIGTTSSWSSPSFPAGYFSTNSPALYYYATTVQIANPADPASYQRWQGNHATVRVANNNNATNLVGGPYGAVGCFFSEISPTDDFYATAWSCGFQDADIDLYMIP